MAYTRITGRMIVAAVLMTAAWTAALAQKPADTNAQKSKSAANMHGAQSNPLYTDNQNAGSMPGHEHHAAYMSSKADASSDASAGARNMQNGPVTKASAAPNPPSASQTDDNDPNRHHPSEIRTTKAQPSANIVSHETVEYKDPEDMTTRYRAGNNKTAKVKPAGNATGAAVVEYKDGEDGTIHTRPGAKKPN